MLTTTNEEQSLMVDTARRVGEEYGLDYWRELDGKGSYPTEFWRAICKAGLCGIALDEEAGGSGLGMTELALVVEELSASGAGSTIGQLFMLNPIFGGISISRYGTDEMKRTLLPKIVTGDIQCCMALTEPNAGSNTLEMRSFAEEMSGGWRLRGQKIWISAVPQSQKMLVVARTKRPDQSSGRSDGISMFLIDTDRQGVKHEMLSKVGTRCVPASTVAFDDVEIGHEELVGTLHGGWRGLLDVLNTERIVTTAGLIGTVRLACRLGVDYANERKVFGDKPISSYQGIQFPLASALSESMCARSLNLVAASKFDKGMPYGSEANMSKLIAARAASHATEAAMQAMGGMGFSTEMHVERLWRDARLFRFAPISEEMILNYIAVHDLGMARGY
jgi:acyl-CoA dehydrogenase